MSFPFLSFPALFLDFVFIQPFKCQDFGLGLLRGRVLHMCAETQVTDKFVRNKECFRIDDIVFKFFAKHYGIACRFMTIGIPAIETKMQ